MRNQPRGQRHFADGSSRCWIDCPGHMPDRLTAVTVSHKFLHHRSTVKAKEKVRAFKLSWRWPRGEPSMSFSFFRLIERCFELEENPSQLDQILFDNIL